MSACWRKRTPSTQQSNSYCAIRCSNELFLYCTLVRIFGVRSDTPLGSGVNANALGEAAGVREVVAVYDLAVVGELAA